MAIGSKEILNVNKILNSITMDIKEKYKNIVEENQEISASIANLNNISSSILESISDIYNKIEFIMNGTNKILQKQTETKI
jgi:flagellar motility protein MotE (MotC chaperone)